MSKPVVYLGPSLDAVTARQVLDAIYLPPIKRGDLAQLGPEVSQIGIIDGEFFQGLAVSTMEILPFLDRGVKVYGAASMGALRAMETEVYGMTGVGEIFQWFRDGVVDADDEVAVAYDPVTYRTTSEALINIRFALREAVSERLLDEAKVSEVVEAIRKIYFPLRSVQHVFQLCPGLAEFFRRRQPNQKRDDALLLLQTMAQAQDRGGEAVLEEASSS